MSSAKLETAGAEDELDDRGFPSLSLSWAFWFSKGQGTLQAVQIFCQTHHRYGTVRGELCTMSPLSSKVLLFSGRQHATYFFDKTFMEKNINNFTTQG